VALIRENIEAERGRKQMSKEALSRELNITSRTYWNYLAGGPIPSDKLVHMARLFECSTDYLLGLTDRRTTA
jgi:transcriptional regulator with XRE-family HTH domain